MANLPITNFWQQPSNPVEQLFWGRANIEFGAAFLYFEKGSKFQNIFHELKYHGKKDVGVFMGKLFGRKLADSRFRSVDLLLPVPLHKSRMNQRGYNQSECIAQGISEIMLKPIDNNSVIRKKATSTQTSRSRYDRWLNVERIYECKNPHLLENKHVLLIDDIITTGATTESLIQEISAIKGIKVSVATLAIA
ncbi:MAG: ComF family protein [Bacteroidales bacterium]|nr:ComF family protein [Bacteroidales bacterium]